VRLRRDEIRVRAFKEESLESGAKGGLRESQR
jgi:hypothetical protein